MFFSGNNLHHVFKKTVKWLTKFFSTTIALGFIYTINIIISCSYSWNHGKAFIFLVIRYTSCYTTTINLANLSFDKLWAWPATSVHASTEQGNINQIFTYGKRPFCFRNLQRNVEESSRQWFIITTDILHQFNLITVHKRYSFRKSLGLFLQSLCFVSKCRSNFGGFTVSFLSVSLHNTQDETAAVTMNPYFVMNHHTGLWFITLVTCRVMPMTSFLHWFAISVAC